MFYCFLQQKGTDHFCVCPLLSLMVFSSVAWVRRDEFRGSGQREVNQRPGSLVLFARSRICSPVAGDEARVESYVGSFISKQPENRITFSSKQANGRSTHLRLTLLNPTLFVGVSWVSDAGLCFCGVCLTQVSKVSKDLQRISRMKMSPCITGETKMAAVLSMGSDVPWSSRINITAT